jgi:arginase
MGGRKVAVISVAMDLGAGRRGVDMGPSAIRIAGLNEALTELGCEVRELGHVTAPGPETVRLGRAKARYLRDVVDVCIRLRDRVTEALATDCLPLVLGGDHSISVGTVAGLVGHHRARDERVGLIWVDAHSDMNTPDTTPSGNVHGMALASLLGHGAPELIGLAGDGRCLDPAHVSLIATRSVDPDERRVVGESGARVFTMSEVDERGMAACVDEAIQRATAGTAGFHLSFDVDAVDPLFAPGVGTPVPGGISYREAHLICEKVARSGGLIGVEMVEINPVLDSENRTARLAVGLIASALGKTIL